MKKTLLILTAMLLCSSTLYAQDSFLKKYSKKKGVEYVEIGSALLSFSDSKASDKIEKMTIISVEDNDSVSKQLKAEIDIELQKEEYSNLMNASSGEDEDVQIYFYDDKKGNKAFIVYAQEDDEIAFISIRGDFKPEDMQDTMDIVDDVM